MTKIVGFGPKIGQVFFEIYQYLEMHLANLVYKNEQAELKRYRFLHFL